MLGIKLVLCTLPHSYSPVLLRKWPQCLFHWIQVRSEHWGIIILVSILFISFGKQRRPYGGQRTKVASLLLPWGSRGKKSGSQPWQQVFLGRVILLVGPVKITLLRIQTSMARLAIYILWAWNSTSPVKWEPYPDRLLWGHTEQSKDIMLTFTIALCIQTLPIFQSM